MVDEEVYEVAGGAGGMCVDGIGEVGDRASERQAAGIIHILVVSLSMWDIYINNILACKLTGKTSRKAWTYTGGHHYNGS